MIGHALQIREDLMCGRDHPKIASHRSLGRNQENRGFLASPAGRIDQFVLAAHIPRQIDILRPERIDCTRDRLVHHAGDGNDIISEILDLLVVGSSCHAFLPPAGLSRLDFLPAGPGPTRRIPPPVSRTGR